MAKAYITRNDRSGQTELDFATIREGIEKLAHCPTIYGHRVRGFELHHPLGDMPWTATVECTDSKSGERFEFSVIFRD